MWRLARGPQRLRLGGCIPRVQVHLHAHREGGVGGSVAIAFAWHGMTCAYSAPISEV